MSEQKSNQHRLLPVFTGLFVATLLISNVLATKIIHIFGADFSSGIILFPLAYVFGDILTEVYGYKVTRRVIWTGFASLLLMNASIEIARVLPASDFWKSEAAFDSVFVLIPRISMGSLIAYLCGEFVNSYVVAKMKVSQKGRYMSVRLVLSTLLGQAMDSVVFGVIAFGGTMQNVDLAYVIMCGWTAKVAWEVVALPITVPVIKWIKRVEHEDFYDKKTNFNPFSN